MSETRCPRCGGAFTCGAAGPGPCACAGITLPESLRADLRRRYTGCLCQACLSALAHNIGTLDVAQPVPPWAGDPTTLPPA